MTFAHDRSYIGSPTCKSSGGDGQNFSDFLPSRSSAHSVPAASLEQLTSLDLGRGQFRVTEPHAAFRVLCPVARRPDCPKTLQSRNRHSGRIQPPAMSRRIADAFSSSVSGSARIEATALAKPSPFTERESCPNAALFAAPSPATCGFSLGFSRVCESCNAHHPVLSPFVPGWQHSALPAKRPRAKRASRDKTYGNWRLGELLLFVAMSAP